MSSDQTMPGSRAANQSKTESIPPTQGHPEPAAGPEPTPPDLPELADMSVGAGDPQAPSHPAAGDRGDRSHAGVPALEEVPTAAAAAPGTAFRQPGSTGSPGGDEQVDTDVVASADQTQQLAGPAEGDLAPGTSETTPVTEGARTPT